MNEKITLIYVAKTGNVLAYVTRNAEPDAEITAAALVGDALPARALATPAPLTTTFNVPAEELAVLTVDSTPDLLLSPREHFVDDEKTVRNIAATPSVSNANPPAAPGDKTQVEVELSLNVTEEKAVWIQLTGPDPDRVRVMTGKIAANTKTTLIDVGTMTPGTYLALAFVTGLRPRAESFTIT